MIRKILLSVLLLAGSLAAQNQFWVSPSGSDTNPGTQAQPWQTFNKAIASFTLSSAGALIHFAGGNYTFSAFQSCFQGYTPSICISRGGASVAAPLILQCDDQWTVPSSSAGCHLSSTTGHSIFSVGNVNYVVIRGFEMSGSATAEAVTASCDGNNPTKVVGTCPAGNGLIVDGNYFHDIGQTAGTGCPSTGVVAVGPSHGANATYSTPPIVRNNRFQHIGNLALARKNGGTCNQYHAVYLSTPGSVVQSNLFLDVVSFSIHVYSYPCSGVITGNTVVRDGANGILYGGGDCTVIPGRAAGLGTISNNISIDSGQQNIATGVTGGGAVACTPSTPNLLTNNVTGGGTGAYVQTSSCSNPVNQINGVAGTSLFVNYLGSASTANGNDDLHLKAGSPAINAGLNGCVSGGTPNCDSTADFSGNARHNPPSIGAYEFVTGGVPIVSLTPSPLAFGTVSVSTPLALTLTQKNTGGANLTFSTATITGTNASDFRITTNPCVSPQAAGASCGYVITFTPSATGARSATFALNDNAAGSPHQVPLTGSGGAVALTLTPTSLTFGNVAPAQCSAAPFPLVTITSTGSAPLIISGETIGGANPADFQFGGTGSCVSGRSYAPGQSCTISQKFCPTSAGAKSATVLIATNAPGSPQSFTETGGAGTSTATLTPTTFPFGNQQVGTSSPAQNFTYTNTGTQTLTGVAVSITGAATSYSQTNNCPASVAAGGNCTIAVVFKPATSGALAATLAVASSATVSPTTTALSGTGTTASLTLAPTAISFADTLVGNFSAVANVTVTNTGNVSVNISGVSVVGANPGDFTAGECAVTATGFTDNFDQGALSSKWQIDTGTAPGTIAGVNTGTFSAANVDLSNGMLGLKVTQSGFAPAISVGGEVRSTTAFGFGTYKWSSRMASTATSPFLTGTVPTGQVSSNFILNSSISNPYTEIDSPEVTGNQPNLIQWTSWTTTSLKTSSSATLANPELAFHLYSFKWAAASVIFSIDGTVSQTHTTNVPTAFANPMMNLWGTNSTFGGAVTAGTRWMFIKAFSFTPSGTTSLAPAASCTIPVYFSPQSTGLKTATLSVADSAAGSPHQAALSGNGTAPSASLSPTSHDFGSQASGTQGAPFNFTWSNTGTGPMRWTVSLAGINPGDFVLGANSCAMPLPGGQNCLIPVSFAPTATGARAATLTLVNSAGTPVTAALTGTGVATAPAVCLSRTSINFGNMPVGQTSGTFPTTVTNCGNANLVVSSVTPTGDFTETTTCATVIPGGTCTVNAKFAPTVAGARTGNVSIASNAASTPDLISLAGFGTQSGATLTSTAAFGHVTVGNVAFLPLTLTNIGNVSLALDTITITGPGAAQFSFGTTCPNPMPVASSCPISVAFTPLSAGSFTATLNQPFTDGTAMVTSALSGTGDAALPTVTLTPTAIQFGDVQQGLPSTTKTIQLQNTSTVALNVTSILPTGANAADVGITSHCGATPVSIPAGTGCTIDVAMTPSTVGDESAAVTVTSNAASSPDSTTLTIRGTAVPVPRALLSPTSLSFSPPSIQTGLLSAAQSVTLNNIGNANLQVTGVAITGANAADFTQTNNCGTVLPGANCSAAVNCAPGTDTGSLTANLVFTDNDSTVTQTATLTCTAFAGTPIITLGVTSIDFGNQTVGTTSGPLVFVPVNTGTADATGVSITATGDFAVSGTCGSTIAQGGHCSESVTFTPPTLCGQTDPNDSTICVSNVHLGQIFVVSNTSNTPQIITLKGTAIPVPPPPGPIKVILGGVLKLGGHLVVGVQ